VIKFHSSYVLNFSDHSHVCVLVPFAAGGTARHHERVAIISSNIMHTVTIYFYLIIALIVIA